MQREGPCLTHCYTCSVATVRCAQAAFVYVVACVIYLLATPCLGTPFLDSLSPEQRQTKRESAAKRLRIFAASVAIGLVLVATAQPFRQGN
jgi:hypothetical protein